MLINYEIIGDEVLVYDDNDELCLIYCGVEDGELKEKEEY